MRNETAKGAATRQHIIRTAADLFHKQGVGATSPDEIIEAAAIGKGQFYHYFGSKEGLVHQVLQSYIDGVESGTAPVDYDVRSWADLERWFASHVELQKAFRMARGCPFGTIGNGITQTDEPIRRDLAHLFDIVKSKLRAFFITEKALGRLIDDANEDRLADFCIAAVQGAMLMGKIKKNAQPAEAAIEQALAHLRGYAKRQQGDAPDAGRDPSTSAARRGKTRR